MSIASGRSSVGTAPAWPPVPRPVIKLQPVGVLSGSLLGTQPSVGMVNQLNGEDLSLAGITVTASINSGVGVLSGTTGLVTSALGLAAYTDLIITGLGNFTLKFDAGVYGFVVSAVIGL